MKWEIRREAEEYFLRVAKVYPKESSSQVALGDLYSSERIFDKAQASYENAYKRNKTNPLIISGGHECCTGIAQS